MARRRLTKVLLTLLLLCIGVPSLYAVLAFGLALIPVNGDFVEPPPGEGVEIQLVSNGIHVDYLLPVESAVMDWSQRFPRSTFRSVGEDWRYVLVGWGDRGIYLDTPTWAELKASTALKAIFWPSPTALHVQYLPRAFVESESIRWVRVSEDAYRELCDFIEESFQRDRDGNPLLIPGKGYGAADNFYEGRGHYHAFNTCNSWTVRGLKRIGVPTALWSPFAFGVLRHLP
jgi:uncharacterized protein (TIGR02117 family)